MKKIFAEHGGIFALVCISLVMLALFLALAIDIGWVVYAKRQAQTAVDAAAMAGAAALPSCHSSGDQTRAETLAKLFNQGDFANRVMGSSADIGASSTEIKYVDFDFQTRTYNYTAFNNSNGIEITKKYTVGHFIKAFTGLYSTDVEAKAVAVLGGVGCVKPTLPITLINCESATGPDYLNFCTWTVCNTQKTITYKDEATGEDNGAWFVPVVDGVGNANANVCMDLVQGVETMDEMCSGGEMALQNGMVTSCMGKIEEQFEAHNAAGTEYKAIIPVIDCVDFSDSANDNFNGTVKILGFTKVQIISITSTGGDKNITFMFLCEELQDLIVPGGRCCGLTASTPILVE